jgi:predicted nucleic-acid-binding protein
VIAIDTNVLLRYLLWDDEEQAERARRLIDGPREVLITDVILVETLSTLSGKKYRLDKDGIIALLNALFEEPNLVFEDGQTIWRALHDYRQATPFKSGGKWKDADFSDALIVNKARYHAHQTGRTPGPTYTFDRAAQTLPGMAAPDSKL